MEDPSTTMIIDIGGDTTRIGFANPDSPPKIVCSTRDGIISKGVLVDLEKLESMLSEQLSTLPIVCRNTPVLLIDPPILSYATRELLVQMLFEKFDFPYVVVANSAVLSLYGVGESSGVCIDVGHTATYITPVLNGAVVHKAVECVPVAGDALTNVIHSVLTWSSKQSISKESARDVKEKLSFACDDPLRQKKRSGTAETYALPDGTSIVVDRLRYEASELFFGTSRNTLSKYFPQDPCFSLYDDHCVDFPSLTYSCVQEAVPDTVATESGPESRDGILRKMLLCGGTPKMPGFRERFVLEMNRLSRSTARPTLFRPINHLPHFSMDHPCYVGATIVGAMDLFHHIGVKKVDYNEDGPGIAKRFVF